MKSRKLLTRRSFIQNSGRILGGLLTASAGGYAYSRFLEPKLIQIVNQTLSFERLPDSFAGKRIVLFSDVHLDFHFGLERFEKLIDTLQNLRPDILCFTGDLYDTEVGSSGEACAAMLDRLQVPLGKWAVLGNHDHITGAASVDKVLTRGGFTMLTNRSAVINHEGQQIQMAGVDDIFFGQSDFEAALGHANANLFTIMLAHEPDLADHTILYSVDLQLSGHSHGGQVRLPFIGHLIVPELAMKYPSGLYTLGEGKLLLYTNRGIGHSVHPIRFMCRPEITVITLQRS
ncbi:metallophosphoesterase [Paenibacillus harenae]|uniref:MPP superfamily phosphohydrolase n=1 Tax=Paenibacillus harenae TaxID=306543 RepID=A0ABT9U5C6_PAEHA|nr:metallophosphoesterase [Paenibacillus harenae]MDQ0063368.1 putative MPP superfamily phosphohydrolase [Paenibacillus harenae]MDQ0114845.1 putative MPP superfamily phosphohydrolase [Paenibacillus harenae]